MSERSLLAAYVPSVSALLAGALTCCSGRDPPSTPDRGAASDGGEVPEAGGSGDGGTGGSDAGHQSSNGEGGQDGEGATPGTDGSANSNAGDSALPESGACQLPPQAAAPECFTMFAQIGPTMISTSCMSGEPPQAQGGTVPDGIYALQSRVMYAASCSQAPPMEATIVICGGQWDWVEIFEPLTSSQVAGEYFYNFAAKYGGSSVELTPQCTSDLSTAAETLGYTASAGQLTLVSSDAVTVYVKK